MNEAAWVLWLDSFFGPGTGLFVFMGLSVLAVITIVGVVALFDLLYHAARQSYNGSEWYWQVLWAVPMFLFTVLWFLVNVVVTLGFGAGLYYVLTKDKK